jgi:hypothetical protein
MNDHDSDGWGSVFGPDAEPIVLHTLPDVNRDADASSIGSSSSDEDGFDAFVDAYAELQPEASRRMLSDNAASSSEATVFNIPGISGTAGSDGTWSSVSQLASAQQEADRVKAAAAAAAAVPARAGRIPVQQDFRIIGGAEAARDRCV